MKMLLLCILIPSACFYCGYMCHVGVQSMKHYEDEREILDLKIELYLKESQLKYCSARMAFLDKLEEISE